MKKAGLIITIAAVIGLAAIVLAFNVNETGINDSRSNNQTSSPEAAQANTSMPRYVALAEMEKFDSSKVSIVLYFKADWCITCHTLDKDIEDNIGMIPDDVLIVRVNYDTETALKQKYDVRQQHTLVQINESGEAVKKWVLSPTLADILNKIERS